MKQLISSLLAASSIAAVGANPVWTEGEHGLWRLAFTDGATLSAADVATNGVPGTCRVSRDGAVTRREWKTDWADVTVTETATGEGAVDYRATVTPHGGRTAKMLDLPATLRFAPKDVESFVYPGRGNSGIGMAFNEKFFLPSPPDQPTSWHVGKCSGPKGYLRMYGDYLACLPLEWPKTNLTVTAEGKEWLGVDAPNHFKSWQRSVLRPPKKGKSDLVLVDSPNGPFFSANRFGGVGALWRFGCAGGGGHERVPPCESFILRRLLPKLAQASPTRTRVARLSMRCGPKSGGFVHLSVKEWRTMLTKFLPEGCTYEDVQDVVALRRLFTAKNVLLVVNPYGEFFPVERAEDLMARLDDVKSFVKGGGNWMEVGGYSFYHPLVGGGYHSIREPYPPLFSDFAHLTTKDGRTAAVYGIRPRKPHEPWRNPTPFTPGETALGGDEKGGWYVHSFACWAKDGASFTTPVVRVRTEASLEASLADYAQVNDLTRPLNDKVKDAAKLDLFKRAPLFFLGGTARQKIAALDKIPVPSLLHYSDYLKGGFDKEYPDHLPPRPSFGTEAELRAFHDRAHAKGHLVSPYTNPTWWCDHPRGPSFIAAGEAPLAVGFDGKPYYERYAKNDGWTITFWHPDVQKANRRTVREFTVDYPVDLLFQDQCGARGWRWDFNPASPSPLAYAEGILAMNEEDSRVVPLGTEDGWDQVANQQTAVCGCTWRIVPVQRPVWRDLFKDVYPADSWRIEPVATRLFHDKALFYMHDLGSFVMNERTLAWMFAIGYQLSWRASADGYLNSAVQRDWYAWLQLLQDKVMSRIAGQPLRAFRHDRAPLLALPGDWSREEDDGVVTAQYGDVKVVANLGDVPRVVEDRHLAAYGWWISAPGLEAAKLEGHDPCVSCDGRRWEYRASPMLADAVGEKLVRPTCPYSAMVSPDTKLAVLDLGPAVGPTWTKAGPADWVQSLKSSPLATKQNLKVVRIASVAELKAALAKGRTDYFAIINPYGETVPVEGADRWKNMLDAIRAYVVRGGIWVETGSATFFSAIYSEQGKWKRIPIGTRGVEYIGSPIEMDDIDESPVSLRANATAQKWFSPELLKQIATTYTQVNRGIGANAHAPAFPLIEDGTGRVWFGCHRLGGWGSFWRLGGSNPDRALALAVVPAALLHQFTHVPEPMPPSPFRKVVEASR